jgi:hypothetical protein
MQSPDPQPLQEVGVFQGGRLLRNHRAIKESAGGGKIAPFPKFGKIRIDSRGNSSTDWNFKSSAGRVNFFPLVENANDEVAEA